jgi:DNA-directed RNA polymerase subunit RPC12/RpoP
LQGRYGKHETRQPDANEMKPITARVLITVIVLAFVIGATVLVNSRYQGDFGVGIVLILVPFLALSYSLPYLLPVRCERCGGRMRFHFLKRLGDSPQMFGYICERCGGRHEWEGASSGSLFDS